MNLPQKCGRMFWHGLLNIFRAAQQNVRTTKILARSLDIILNIISYPFASLVLLSRRYPYRALRERNPLSTITTFRYCYYCCRRLVAARSPGSDLAGFQSGLLANANRSVLVCVSWSEHGPYTDQTLSLSHVTIFLSEHNVRRVQIIYDESKFINHQQFQNKKFV